jgi:hypothetical protein
MARLKPFQLGLSLSILPSRLSSVEVVIRTPFCGQNTGKLNNPVLEVEKLLQAVL